MGKPATPETDATPPQAAQPAAAVVLLLTTFPDRERAEAAARHWVEAGLAACVHIAPAGRSVYRWQGAVEVAEEVALTAKTTAERVEALHEALRHDHPYELPEVLLVSPQGGSEAYLGWVMDACQPPAAADAGAAAASTRP
ncbi:MAG: divalent-cation tolerance protein CutA [Rhodocyclaceae bacterium]|nr:divalent-cation tolerance protein CutA [Rhodocyclaceae bacterium]